MLIEDRRPRRLYLARPVALADVVLEQVRCWTEGATIDEVRAAIRHGARSAGLHWPSDADITAALGQLEARGDVTSAPAPEGP